MSIIINIDTFQIYDDFTKWKLFIEQYNENQQLIEQYENLVESTKIQNK